MRKILLTSISLVGLAVLVACGGNSNNTPVPTPPSTGNNAGFSTSSLKGTYVFAANGVTASNNYAVAGTFIADGAGNITGGMRDSVDDGGHQALNSLLDSGSYSVNQDGRGQVVLNWHNAGTGDDSNGKVIYRFVLQSDSKGKLFQVSNIADAIGRIELQSNLVSAFPGSTLILTLNGEDGSGAPYGAVGGLTFSSGGTVTGTIDENDAGTVTPLLTVSGGSYTLAPSSRGTATYTTLSGTHNFIIYEVSPSRIELLSSDKGFFLHGFGDMQTSIAGTVATFSGDQVFSLSGIDLNLVGSIVEAGRLTLNGSGGVTNGLEDYNDAGTYTPNSTVAGNYTVAGTGRWTAGMNTISTGLIGWQVSPTQSAVLTNSDSILETGEMRGQNVNLTNANITGNFAEILSGFFVGAGDVESTGNFLADGNGNFSGTIDSQTPSAGNFDIPETGVYSMSPTGRSSGSVGAVPVVIYAADANTLYLISSDPNRIYEGKMVHQ
jgi:hypothetical protein